MSGEWCQVCVKAKRIFYSCSRLLAARRKKGVSLAAAANEAKVHSYLQVVQYVLTAKRIETNAMKERDAYYCFFLLY